LKTDKPRAEIPVLFAGARNKVERQQQQQQQQEQ